MPRTLELTDEEFETVLRALDWYAEDRIECASDLNRHGAEDATAAAHAVALTERLTETEW